MRLRRLALVLLLAGCKVDPRDLAPFPCPQDGDCPSALACYGGSCVHACKGGEGCSAGEVCTEPASAGFCVKACEPGACDAPDACQSLFYGGLKGCVPAADAGLSPCAEVKVEACVTSSDLCAGQYTTACGDGTYCPAQGTCVGTSACVCADGYEAVDCSGESCDGRACPLFWCRERAIAARCDATPTRTTKLTCVCKDAAKNTPPHVLDCDSNGSCFNYCNEGD